MRLLQPPQYAAEMYCLIYLQNQAKFTTTGEFLEFPRIDYGSQALW